jgi:hypothetical protein
MAVHCPECGFVNPEGANYCQKCGAFLGRPEGSDDPTTMTYKVDETGELQPIDIDAAVEQAGAALVIRSGGGRAGESFTVDKDRMAIGRTPDAAVFLDDVTVSRNHALLVHRADGYYIDDLTVEEQEVSYRRRLLHGKIDILRAELVNRLRKKHEAGESAISGADVQQLTDILTGKAIPDSDG